MDIEEKRKHMNQIRLLIMDVDGTLTDGTIYMSPNGEAMKGFHVRDGYAIKHLLPEINISSAIITGRTSKIVEQRAEDLSVDYLYQGIIDKFEVLSKLVHEMGISLSNCAYIGDDVLDLPCMEKIRATGGITGCPSDAVDEVKAASDFVSSKEGGRGAVREFVEYLSKVSE